MDVNNTAYLISVFYLALQVSGAIFVSLFQTKIIKILGNIFPESEEESLSKMKFISPETSEDPAIAISLVKKEQDRLISTLSYYLEPLRTEEYAISLKVRNDANLHLAGEIKSYIDEISHHDLGEEMSNLLELQSRNEAIISLLASLNTFTSIVSETKDYKEGLSGALIEGLHLILTLLEETVTSNENNEVLIELTSDKSQLMDNIRAALISDESTSVNDRKALFVCTRVFERIVWQIRQMQLSNLRFG
jgi:phosphate:Na+ symporter